MGLVVNGGRNPNGLSALNYVLLPAFTRIEGRLEAGMAEQNQAIREVISQALLVYPTGSFAEAARMRLTEYSMLLPGVIFFYPNVLAFFLIGMLAARRKYFSDYQMHIPEFRRFLMWGLNIGVPGNLLLTPL